MAKRSTHGAWVPAYRTLMRGPNRAIPRAHRMVFLELCMSCRDDGGSTLTFRGDLPAGEAVAEDIGGPASEVEAALATLAAAGKIVVTTGETLTVHIPSIATHSLGEDALRKRMSRDVQTPPDNIRTLCPDTSGHHPDMVSAPSRTHSGQGVRDPSDLEERREEEIKEENTPLPPGGPAGVGSVSMDETEIQSRLLSSPAFRGVDVVGAAASIAQHCALKGIRHPRILQILPWALSQLEDAMMRPDPPKNPATYVRAIVLRYGPPGCYERRDDGQRGRAPPVPAATSQTGGKLPVYEAAPGLSADEKRAQAAQLREAMQRIGKGGTAA